MLLTHYTLIGFLSVLTIESEGPNCSGGLRIAISLECDLWGRDEVEEDVDEWMRC